MNNNPSDMSNEDLEKDMEVRNEDDQAKAPKQDQNLDLEGAEEVEPETKSMDMGVDYKPEKEQDLDELLHEQAGVKQTGSIPDPEEIKFREGQ